MPRVNRVHTANELVIDARCLASGIGTYGFNLLSRLGKTSLRHRTRVITTPQLLPSITKWIERSSACDIPIYSFREQIAIPRVTPGKSLVHALHYNAPVLHRGALLVTIHDLTHILDDTYKKDWRSWLYSRPMLMAAARRADHIFTGTQYVKSCLLEHLGVPETKITICSYGVGEEFAPGDTAAAQRTVQRCTGSDSPYILFVGNLKPHKNIGNLLRAYHELLTKHQADQRLILIGDDTRGRGLVLDQVRDLDLQSWVRLLPRVTHSELIDFYRAADVLVLPSFQEGFGLPVAEAMACGTPVVCSRAAAMPEVGGDAAEYFDPGSSEDIAAKIAGVLSSPSIRDRMSQEGRTQARKFTWDRVFTAHFDVYQQYLRQPAIVPVAC